MKFFTALIVAVIATSVTAKAIDTLAPENAKFLDALTNAFTGILSQVIMPAVNNSLQDLAAIAAQLTAGVAVGGLDALLGLIGKREIVLDRGFWDSLFSGMTDVLNQVVLPAVSISVQDLAALAAQLTAGVAVGGLDALLGLVGKREIVLDRGFWDSLFSGATDVLNQVILPAVSISVQDLAALAAQLTAGVAVGGLDALLGLVGKREIVLDRGFWDSLFSGATDVLNQVILPAVSISVQDLAALAAQLTAGVAVGGLDALLGLVGKRSAEFDAKFLDSLTNAFLGILNQVVMPAVNNSLQDLAAIAAQLTAGVAVGGLDALIGLVGK